MKLNLLIGSLLVYSNMVGVLLAERMPLSSSYWKDPVFLKDFNGSYRINANIEPILTSEQRGELIAVQSLMVKGDRKGAISKLKSSNSFSSSAAVQFNLGNVLTEEGSKDEAIRAYLKALQLLPAFRRAHQNVGYLYFRENDYGKAFTHLMQALQLGSQDGSVYGLLGHCYQQKEQFEQALVSFRNAQLTQPNVTDWKMGVGYALDRLGRSVEALAHFEAIAKEVPDSRAVALQLANLYLTNSKPHEAIVKLELLRRKGELDTAYEILLGTLYLSNQNAHIGADTLRRVIGRGDFKDYPAALQAIRYSLDLSMLELASELHALVVVESLDESEQSRHSRLKAEILLSDEKTSEEAEKILKELVEKDPTDSHSLYLLACLASDKKQKHQSLMLLQQAINSEGSHQQKAMLKKAEVLVFLKQYAEAVESLDRYLGMNASEEVVNYRKAIQQLVTARNRLR